MIFNSEYTGTSSYDDMVVTESPYPLGLEGALMHVWENECNYNAMMKAVGISELRYYQETGGDLFVQEAGAFGGFIAKAKAFFKKVIEKIKQIFHKFMAVINQYTMSDKDFVKKYQKELYRRNLKDFEFDGYTFKDLDKNANDIISNIATAANNVVSDLNKGDVFIPNSDGSRVSRAYSRSSSDIENEYRNDQASRNGFKDFAKDDTDAVEDMKDKTRGFLLKGDDSSSYDHSEFIDELKEKLYGDDGKETFEVKNIREWLAYITETKKDLKNVDSWQKNIVRAIDKFISASEKAQSNFSKIDKDEKAGGADATKEKNEIIKGISVNLDLCRNLSNDATTAFGMITQAVKDRNRQAKAICVKALSYKNKNESATYTESYYDNDDIFANVVIR